MALVEGRMVSEPKLGRPAPVVATLTSRDLTRQVPRRGDSL